MNNVLRVLGKTAGVLGQGYEGYGVDRKTRVAEALAQQEAERNAEDSRIRRLVALTGIDPTKQRELNAAQSAGTTEGATPGLVARAEQMVPVEAKSAAAVTEAQTPGLVARAEQMPVTSVQPSLNQKDPAKAVTVRPGARGTAPQVGVTDVPGVGKVSAGMNTRGFGQGGVFGAGSGIGSVNEMKATNPNLKTFEQKFLTETPTASLDAIDRFKQRLAADLRANHGYISAATATAAENELARTNPELVVYGRDLAQWVISDLNLSRGSTDERQRLDFHVSGLSTPLASMPLPQRTDFINRMWVARDGRLEGLSQAAAAAEVMLGNITGRTGATGAAPPKPPVGGFDVDAYIKQFPVAPKATPKKP